MMLRNAGRKPTGGGGGGGPVLPANQTIIFGAKTRKGHGGHALGYTGTGYLGITAGNTGSIFAIDAYKMIVPAGTYNAAPPVFSGPYLLTITEYSDAGKTIPTGVTGSVTVNIVANAASARNYATDYQYGFQLSDLIDVYTGNVALGDTIYLRDGVYNAATLDLRISGGSAFAGTWSGSNYVTLTSDTPYGATIKFLAISHGTASTPAYIKLYQLLGDRQNTGSLDGQAAGSIYVNNTSYVWADSCTFTSDITATDDNGTNLCGGFITSVGCSFNKVTNCLFDGLDTGINMYGTTNTVQGNDFRRVWQDCLIAGNAENWLVADNFCFEKKYASSGVHGDFLQFNPAGLASGTYVGHKLYRNIMVRGNGTPGSVDGQGIFAEEGGVGVIYTGFEAKGNFYVGTFARGISVGSCTDAQVAFNTLIQDMTTGITFPSVPNPPAVFFRKGTGGRTQYNATAGGANNLEAGNTALTVDVGNILVVGANNAAAYVNPTYGYTPTSRADFLTKFGPKTAGMLDKATTGLTYHTGAGWYDDYAARTSTWPL